MTDKIYLTATELAERWRSVKGTLNNQRAQGKGPPFVKLGGKVLYPIAEIEKYEQANKITPKPANDNNEEKQGAA